MALGVQTPQSRFKLLLPCCWSRDAEEEFDGGLRSARDRADSTDLIARQKFICEHDRSDSLHNDYDMVENGLLGKGGFGIVRKVRLKSDKAIIRALKQVRKKSMNVENTVRQEISMLKHLDHPAITRLIETYEDSRFIYLVMEYIDGRELFDEIQEDLTNGIHFEEHRAACIMRQVYGALQYCHAKRLLHRDMKPENIMVLRSSDMARASTPETKLIDFGLAALAKKKEGISQLNVQGTEAYLAPECRQGIYSSESDMWSTGVIIYVIFMGRFPNFPNLWLDDLDEGVKNGDISLSATQIIKGLLVQDRTKRLSAAQAVAHEWAATNDDRGASSVVHVTDAFKRFHRCNKLQRAAFTAMAMHLSTEQTYELSDGFRAADTDGNGVISRDEFRALNLKDPPHGVEDLDTWVDTVFDELDTDGSGEIDFTEWEAGAIGRITIADNAIEAAFRSFDVHNTGNISVDELLRVVDQGSEEMVELFTQFDLNGDGVLDLEEFKEMLTTSSGSTNSPMFRNTSASLGLVPIPSVA